MPEQSATVRGADNRHKKVGGARRWLMAGLAVIAVVGVLVAGFFISEYVRSPILAQKCGGVCHTVGSLKERNLDAASAATAVDKMVQDGNATLTPQEREAVITALLGK